MERDLNASQIGILQQEHEAFSIDDIHEQTVNDAVDKYRCVATPASGVQLQIDNEPEQVQHDQMQEGNKQDFASWHQSYSGFDIGQKKAYGSFFSNKRQEAAGR